MKKYLVILLAIIFVGCASKQQNYTLNTYSLELKEDIKSYKTSNYSIEVKNTLINKSFNTNAIFYKQQPLLLEKYVKNRWIDSFNLLATQLITQSVEESKIFKTVLISPSKINTDYILNSYIYEIYNEVQEDKSKAILKMKFELYKENKLINSYLYTKSLEIENNKVYGFVKAINKLINEIAEDLNSNIAKEIKN